MLMSTLLLFSSSVNSFDYKPFKEVDFEHNTYVNKTNNKLGSKSIVANENDEKKVGVQDKINTNFSIIGNSNYLINDVLQYNDTDFINQWGLQNRGQLVKYDAGLIDFDIGVSGLISGSESSNPPVTVIIGHRIDISHEDLQGRIWSNPNEANNQLDDDGNGYIDDINGLNAVHMNGDVAGKDEQSTTAMAGVISAITNNSKGIAGISENKILTCVVFEGRAASGASIQECFNYIVALKETTGINIQSVILDFGAPGVHEIEFRWLAQEIEKLVPLDILVISPARHYYDISMRNIDRIPDFPSSFNIPNLISVAGSDKGGAMLENSSLGPRTIHTVAPGEDIMTTVPGEFPEFNKDNSAFFEDFEEGFLQWDFVGEGYSIEGEESSYLKVTSPGNYNLLNSEDVIESKALDLSEYRGKVIEFTYRVFADGNTTKYSQIGPISVEKKFGSGLWQPAASFVDYLSDDWQYYQTYITIPDDIPEEQLEEVRIRLIAVNLRYWTGSRLIDDLAIADHNPKGISNLYEYYSGNNLAAAHVAGSIALVKSLRPDLKAVDIKNLIISAGQAYLSENAEIDGTNSTVGGRSLKVSSQDSSSILSCSGNTVTRLIEPKWSGYTVGKGANLGLGVLNIICNQSNGAIEVDIEGELHSLNDMGFNGDKYSGDGVYSTLFNFKTIGDKYISVNDDVQSKIKYRVYEPYLSPVEVQFEWLMPENGVYEAENRVPPFAINIGNIIDDHVLDYGMGFSIWNGEIHVNIDNVEENTVIKNSKSYNTRKSSVGMKTLPVVNPDSKLIIAPYRHQNLVSTMQSEKLNFTIGEAPNRKWVIEWRNLLLSSCGFDGITFQTVFSEEAGDIQFNYKNDGYECNGYIPTAGIQIGFDTWSIYEMPIEANTSLRFYTASNEVIHINQAPEPIKEFPFIEVEQLVNFRLDLREHFKDENIDTVTFNLSDTAERYRFDGIYVDDAYLVIDTRDIGRALLKIKAVDEQGRNSNTETIVVDILSSPPEYIKEIEDSKIRVGQIIEINLDEHFKDNLDQLSYSLEGLSHGYKLNENVLTFDFEEPGTNEYFVYAKDNDNLTTMARSVIIVSENDKPIANDDSFETIVNTDITLNILQNDRDSYGSLYLNNVEIVNNVRSGTLSKSETTLRYKPNTNFSGEDIFKYKVMGIDGVYSDTATVRIQVNKEAEESGQDGGSSSGGGSIPTLLLIILSGYFGFRLRRSI